MNIIKKKQAIFYRQTGAEILYAIKTENIFVAKTQFKKLRSAIPIFFLILKFYLPNLFIVLQGSSE